MWRAGCHHPERSYNSHLLHFCLRCCLASGSLPSLLCTSVCVNMKFPVEGPRTQQAGRSRFYLILSTYFQRMVGLGSPEKNTLCALPQGPGHRLSQSLKPRMCCMLCPSLEAHPRPIVKYTCGKHSAAREQMWGHQRQERWERSIHFSKTTAHIWVVKIFKHLTDVSGAKLSTMESCSTSWRKQGLGWTVKVKWICFFP